MSGATLVYRFFSTPAQAGGQSREAQCLLPWAPACAGVKGKWARWLGLVGLLFLAACASTRQRPHSVPATVLHPPPRPHPVTPVEPPKPTTATLSGVRAGPSIESLGLTPDNAKAALAAFRLSCPALVRRTDVSGLTRQGDWAGPCNDAATRLDVDGPDFFAKWFEADVVGDGSSFATGYYEPEILGSRDPIDGYDTPIYRRPPDLVTGEFAVAPDGTTPTKRTGRMQDGQFVPYYDRAAIDAGALSGQGLEIAYARDPIEFFFLQIQGSGRLLLPDGTVMRIGYDGQNAREYVAVGRIMKERGLIGPGQLSMQGVMAGLRAQPDGGRALMEEDKSYVFFKEVVGPGPLGALGVPVVGHVSVAADPKFIPLGAPLFLTMDKADASGLWVAQDTGGAIKGANRFDTFWGAGANARTIAGGMSAHGKALILLPKGTAERLRTTGALGGGYGGASAQR